MSFYDVTRDELISGVGEVTSITASLHWMGSVKYAYFTI
jgi:hypothetical protein